MTDEEGRDARVVRRWRQGQLMADPPRDITKEEEAYVEGRMRNWTPQPYVSPWDDYLYPGDEATNPWERAGWDPIAAMSPDYILPRDETPDLDDSVIDNVVAVAGDSGLMSTSAAPPCKKRSGLDRTHADRKSPRHCACRGRLAFGQNGKADEHDAVAV